MAIRRLRRVMTLPRKLPKLKPINYIDIAVSIAGMSIISGWLFSPIHHNPNDERVLIPLVFYVAGRAMYKLIKSL